MKKLQLVFLGTPEFGIPSLEGLLDAGHEVKAVVTAPDKQAGRGMKWQESAVKQFAVKRGLKILQPTNLKSPEFIEELRFLNADLFVVIAFRMLPEVVWNMPPMGTMNLHASLLPAYRGAAPINHAIINGETETGVTTFLLKHEIDTGDILMQEKVTIYPEDTAGTLHDRLMMTGREMVVKSVNRLANGDYSTLPQKPSDYEPIAPKIQKNDCLIDWNKPCREVNNLIRGLSPYPVARTLFNGKVFKIYSAEIESRPGTAAPGTSEILDRSMRFACTDGYIYPIDVQPEGKKRMKIVDFVNGLKW